MVINLPQHRIAPIGTRLLRTPEPLPNESLMGYIVRLTEANGYESPDWIFDLAGLRRCQIHGGWRALCAERTDLTLFCRIAGLTSGQVEKLKHPLMSREEFGQEDCRWHTRLPDDDLDFQYSRVCPECLRESAYCRKLWDIYILTACPRHRVLLLEQCPACGDWLSWKRKSVCVCNCGFDWRRAKAPELAPSQCRALEWLVRSQNIAPFEDLSTRENEHSFERLGFFDLCHMLYHLAPYFPLDSDGGAIQPAPPGPLHRALEAVIAAFDDWPDSFMRACELFMQNRERIRIANNLFRLADHSSLAFLRVAYEEQHRSTLTKLRFLPAWKVRHTLMITDRGFETLLSTGKLRAVPDISKERPLLIDGTYFDKLLRERELMLTERGAASLLGIARHELRDLIHYDCLSLASGPHIDGFLETRLDPLALATFDRRLERLSKPLDGDAQATGASGDLIRLDKAKALLQIRKLSFGQMMRAVLEGEITPVRLRPPTHLGFIITRLLTDIAFRKDQFLRYLDRHSPIDEKRASKKAFMPLWAITISIKRKWDNRRIFTRQGVETYDIMKLRDAAKAILQPSKKDRPSMR